MRLISAFAVQKSESYDADGFNFLTFLEMSVVRDLTSASSSSLGRLASCDLQSGSVRVLLERAGMDGPAEDEAVERADMGCTSFVGLDRDERRGGGVGRLDMVAAILLYVGSTKKVLDILWEREGLERAGRKSLH